MEISVALALPREALSVRVIRQVLGDALRTLGAAEDSVADVLLAISEACTNVLYHAGPGDFYEVAAHVRDHRFQVEVVDRGGGFDPAAVGPPTRWDAEGGRGIQLMRALVDDVAFEGRPDGGTVVSLRKRLGWRGDPPAASPVPPQAQCAS